MHASTYLAIIATHKNYYHNFYPRAPPPLLCINFDLVSVAPACMDINFCIYVDLEL